MAEPVAVRRATAADLRYVSSLSGVENKTLGFIPDDAYGQAVDGRRPGHRVWLAEVNDDPVGFLYLSPGEPGGSAKILQVAVQRDARRLDYARALVEAAEAHARLTQRPAVTCRVASELEATAFWDALGYALRGTEPGGARRGRTIQLRRRRLPSGLWVEEDYGASAS
jgi:GNAT superfamily N-acetyltransferase